MKMLHKFHVQMDQKKYNLRIFENSDDNLTIATIADYGNTNNKPSIYRVKSILAYLFWTIIHTVMHV